MAPGWRLDNKRCQRDGNNLRVRSWLAERWPLGAKTTPLWAQDLGPGGARPTWNPGSQGLLRHGPRWNCQNRREVKPGPAGECEVNGKVCLWEPLLAFDQRCGLL